MKLFFEAGTGVKRVPGIQDDSAPIDYAKQAAEVAATGASQVVEDPFAEAPPPASSVRVPPETMPESEESIFGMNGPISIEWGSLTTKLSAPVRITNRP